MKELVKLSLEVAWEGNGVRWRRERDIDGQVSTIWQDMLAYCLSNQGWFQKHGADRKGDSEVAERGFQAR